MTVLRIIVYASLGFAGIFGGIAFVSDLRPDLVLRGIALIFLGCLAFALMDRRLWLALIPAERPPTAGPKFEAGDPNTTADPATAPLIQAMHRVRRHRPPRE